MPAAQPTLTYAHAMEHVVDHVFGGAPDPASDACDRNGFGIELEFLTGTSRFERLTLADAESLMARLDPLPRRSRLTLEPGGQLELSTQCFGDLGSACEAAATDLFHLDQAGAAAGIDLVALG